MAQISRLKDLQISNGNVINADDLDAEYNQLLSESNAQDTRLTNLESGTITLQGVKTFDSQPKVDGLQERTAGAGIAIESVILKSGTLQLTSSIDINGVNTTTNIISTTIAHGLAHGTAVQFASDNTLPSPLSESTTYYVYAESGTTISVYTSQANALAQTSPINITTAGTGNHAILADPPSNANGQLWMNAAEGLVKVHLNDTTQSLALSDSIIPPQYFIGGPAPSYTSASSITLPSGLIAFDTTGVTKLDVTTDLVLDLTTTGANGLDTGTEAVDTFYYAYLVGDSTGTNPVAGLLSATNEAASGSITLPSGYDAKHQLPLAIKNDASGNIIPFYVAGGWPFRTEVMYEVELSEYNVTTPGPTNIENGFAQASFTDVDCSDFVPPISTLAKLHACGSSGGDTFRFRRKGNTNNGWSIRTTSGKLEWDADIEVPTNASQVIQAEGNTMDIAIAGYTVTEM